MAKYDTSEAARGLQVQAKKTFFGVLVVEDGAFASDKELSEDEIMEILSQGICSAQQLQRALPGLLEKMKLARQDMLQGMAT